MAANENNRSFGGGCAAASASAGRSEQGEFSIRSAYERGSRRSGAFTPADSFVSRSSLVSEAAAAAGAAKASAEAAKSTAGGKFAAGDRVQHKVFGVGTVVSVTPVAGDMLVEVQFEKGVKKMMANYAPLTKAE